MEPVAEITRRSPPQFFYRRSVVEKYPEGRYLESFSDFVRLCTPENAGVRFVFQRLRVANTNRLRLPGRESRGCDGPLTTVPWGKCVSLVEAPLSDCPEKRFFMNSADDENDWGVRNLIIEQISKLESSEYTEGARDVFNELRWYIDTRDESLNWVITHIYNPEKHKVFFNDPENGFRIYVLE